MRNVVRSQDEISKESSQFDKRIRHLKIIEKWIKQGIDKVEIPKSLKEFYNSQYERIQKQLTPSPKEFPLMKST